MPPPVTPTLTQYTGTLPDVNDRSTWNARVPPWWDYQLTTMHNNLLLTNGYSEDAIDYIDAALQGASTIVDAVSDLQTDGHSRSITNPVDLTTENLDAIITGGAYSQVDDSSATLALGYPVTRAGSLLVQSSAAERVVSQIYVVRSGVPEHAVFYRAWVAWQGVWTAWSRVTSSADFTSGSNASGAFHRDPTGRQTCHIRDLPTAGGSVVWTFPAAFVGTPTVTATISGGGAVSVNGISSTSTSSTLSSGSGTINAVAIGNWQ